MKRSIVTLLILFAIVATGWSQQTIVFPAVSDEVEGRNGSLWVTVARIIKVDPRDNVTIRRKWVCLPDGGFLEDPDDPLTYYMLPDQRRYRILMGEGDGLLLYVDADLGAVAYEVEGGEVIAHSYVVDVSRGMQLPFGIFAAGQGQFIRAMSEPLRGPSHIPWLGGCLNAPCSREDGEYWNFYRHNIGIVNPNPAPLTITGTVIPFTTQHIIPKEIDDPDPESFSRVVPAYGWLQFNWVSQRWYGSHDTSEIIAMGGFVISLTPDKDLPYYAYASVVFTPDPESGIPVFNDPMFVPAEPGYIAPWREVYPPPK